jgi:hypothetical protein
MSNAKTLYSSILIIFIFQFILPSIVFSQGIQEYRVGSSYEPGTDYWTFSYTEKRFMMLSELEIAVVKYRNRFALLVRHSKALGDLEIILDNREVINCIRRPEYDHFFDGELNTMYFLTQEEVQKMSRSDIDHIISTENPSSYRTFNELRDGRQNVDSYYQLNNYYEYFESGSFGKSKGSNNTARDIRTLLRHIENPRSSQSFRGSLNTNSKSNCNCQNVVTNGNRSYMCVPLPIYDTSNLNVAVSLIESNSTKYVLLNALYNRRARAFEGGLNIEFRNGRTHYFRNENSATSTVGGEELIQGVFRIVSSSESSIEVSDIDEVSFKFDNGREYTLRSSLINRDVLRNQIQCF